MRLDKLALFVVWIAACSANQDRASRVAGNTGGSAGSSDGGTIGVGGSGGGASTPCTSDADCPPSSFCGKTNVCVPDGRCISDGDCKAPQTCGKGSGTCLDPGSCVGDGDCAAGSSCKAGKCEIGTGCGQSEFAITQVAPNAMLLVDRSGSMDGDAGGDTRWNVAKKAVETVTNNFNDRIRFGLSTYSSCLAGGCSAGSIVVPIADQNATAINGFLATTVDQRSDDGRGTNPDGTIRYLCDSGDPETSTGKSLSALVGEPSLQDAQRTNIVILLTDGAESGECTGGCDAVCAAQNLLMQPQPVKTYVVGLGLNQGVLDQVAAAGGTSRMVPANNLVELNQAFDQIAKVVASCEYVLDQAPPGLDLYVYFNDEPAGIPKDTTNGWSYDPVTRKLTFHGAACDRIKNGQVTDIDIVYGCPAPVPT